MKERKTRWSNKMNEEQKTGGCEKKDEMKDEKEKSNRMREKRITRILKQGK